MTKQRKIVYDIMRESDGHMTAEEVYKSAKVRMPKIGIATVYRNLNKLVDDGMLSKIDLGNDSITYDITTVLHAHLVCSRCGKITDIILNSKVFQKEMDTKRFHATEYAMVIRGICGDCASNDDYVF